MLSPQIYLIGALLLANGATYGVMWVKREAAVKAAYSQGIDTGKGQVAAAVTKSAHETVTAVAQGEQQAEPVSGDKTSLIALCKRSASCRERQSVSRETAGAKK